MANAVNQLYTQVYQARQGAVTILPLVKPHALLLAGRREHVERAACWPSVTVTVVSNCRVSSGSNTSRRVLR